MTKSTLEIAMERVKALADSGARAPTPHMFREPEPTPVSRPDVSGHRDRQEHCHCGFNQTCPALFCAACDRRSEHAMVFWKEIDEEYSPLPDGRDVYLHLGYHPCSRCGEKKWLYACEARKVERR